MDLSMLATIINNMILFATPLIFAALGGVFNERSGVVNIGLEGLMLFGAFTGAVVSISTSSHWAGIIAAIVAGALFALPHAVATVTFKADQIVSGVALNFLSLGLAIFLLKLIYDGAAQTPTIESVFTRYPIPLLSSIPFLGPAIFTLNPTSYLAFIVVGLAYYVLFKTPFGLRIRAVGEHPHAADTAGISVTRMRYYAVMLSGALASLGGAVYPLAISNEFSQTTIAGQGFMALAAMIFGKWHPVGAMGAALFFGFTTSLAITGQVYGLTKYIPGEVLYMLPFVFTILALAGFVGRADAPAAIGRPYEKGSR